MIGPVTGLTRPMSLFFVPIVRVQRDLRSNLHRRFEPFATIIIPGFQLATHLTRGVWEKSGRHDHLCRSATSYILASSWVAFICSCETYLYWSTTRMKFSESTSNISVKGPWTTWAVVVLKLEKWEGTMWNAAKRGHQRLRTVFHPLYSLPEDLLHLVVNILSYLSRRYGIHNDSCSSYIPSQAYWIAAEHPGDSAARPKAQ